MRLGFFARAPHPHAIRPGGAPHERPRIAYPRITVLSACVLGAILTACAPDPEEPEPLDPVTQAIVGGAPASACQWPTTVSLRGCTATLIDPVDHHHRRALRGGTHDRLVRRSPHQGGARLVPIEYCRKATDGDVAFCKLAMPVTDVPLTPVLMGCETGDPKPGQKVTSAGFGRTTARGVAGGTSGVKYVVELMVHSISSSGKVITIYAPNKGLCFGDSGGPAYVRVADGSWRGFRHPQQRRRPAWASSAKTATACR